MSELNSFQLQGRIVRDAEFVSTSGTKVVQFSLGTNRSWKNKNGEWVNIPSYFNFSIFGEYAEKTAEKLKQGKQVIVEGYLKQDRWEKDGKTQSRVSFGVNRIHFIHEKNSTTTGVVPASGEEPIECYDSEIPFGDFYVEE